MDDEVKKEYDELKAKAEQGNAETQYRFAWFCQNEADCYDDDEVGGENNESLRKEAIIWFQKAAAQWHPEAQCSLGRCYYTGIGVNKDYAQAVIWYTKAAENGNAEAQHSLGFCYYFGLGIAKNQRAAEIWRKKAAKQGYIAIKRYADTIAGQKLLGKLQ